MLASEDCYAYWQNVDLDVPAAERATQAFERRWFGAKSEARVRTLMGDMAQRFDAYPKVLAALQDWRPVPAALRPWICHWHVQLADPIYRRFTGEYLPERRSQGLSKVDRDAASRWVEQTFPERWSTSTTLKFGANMLSTAADAGIVAGRRDPRQLTLPAVPNAAVTYVLYLLRQVNFEGSLLDNPYLHSVGLDAEELPRRLASLPDVSYRRIGNAHDVEWPFDDLHGWVRSLSEVAA